MCIHEPLPLRHLVTTRLASSPTLITHCWSSKMSAIIVQFALVTFGTVALGVAPQLGKI